MTTYRIATIPGDGIGKEVVPAGRVVLMSTCENGTNTVGSAGRSAPAERVSATTPTMRSGRFAARCDAGVTDAPIPRLSM